MEYLDLQLCDKKLSPRENMQAKVTPRKPGPLIASSYIASWKSQMDYSTDDVLKKILQATTPMVDVEENREHNETKFQTDISWFRV